MIDYFGVAMATASTEDDVIIKDVTVENDDDDNVVIGVRVSVCLSVCLHLCTYHTINRT